MPETNKEALMKTIIFDLDGTLVNTSGDLIAAANFCFIDMGYGALLDPERDAPTALRGGRAMLSLGLSRVDDLDQAVIDRYYPRLLEAYDQSIAKHSYLFPSVRQVIQQLNNAGFLLGICTNKPEALAEKLMHALKFRDPFLSLIGADTVSSRKPNPMPFFEAVYRVGGIPERSCLVGDSVTDFDTACAAGVPSILVDFGFATQDLAMLQPVSLITHFDQLEATLNKLQL